ncbi:unnamed protein product [Rotaria sp. Silwood2]|nr:unnamed protein product [Rotaria sp. Silwood2]CAF3416396.1 unnamed protein product [Rotaria sp. Silwood2]CAF4178268.1 unnamed protein product [Rotaria sp. Silwood2]CAF4397630.1 unnamed protein product [Rotaria sp. Silwood2]
MLKTEAYEEIKDGHCPLANNFYAVQNLLNNLVSKKALTKQQRNKMVSRSNKLELGYYHGLPKPHKPGRPL